LFCAVAINLVCEQKITKGAKIRIFQILGGAGSLLPPTQAGVGIFV